MRAIKCFLEGDAYREFRPRRLSLVYEVEAQERPPPIELRCKLMSNLILSNFNPRPSLISEDEYIWILEPQRRGPRREGRYIYSASMNAEGIPLYHYASYIAKELKQRRSAMEKTITVSYAFNFHGLEEHRVIIGPIPEIISLRDYSGGILRHWGVRGYGELYFLIYEEPEEIVKLELRLPSQYVVTLAGRIEGKVKRGYEGMSITINDEEIDKELRIMAFMEDLLL